MNYDNNNRAAIWGNDKKEKDSHPDFRGTATIDGVEYFVSAWKRSPDANPKAPALSLRFENRAEAEAKGMKKAKHSASFEDDQIPF